MTIYTENLNLLIDVLGQPLNELCDNLARIGHNFDDVNHLSSTIDSKYCIRYNFTHQIDFKRHIKTLQAIFRDTAISLHLPSSYYSLPAEFKSTVYRGLLSASRGKYFSTSKKENREASFCLRFLFNQLPLMSKMCHYNPLYANYLCKRCHSTKENRDHLSSCEKVDPISIQEIIHDLVKDLGAIPSFLKEHIYCLIQSIPTFFKEFFISNEFIEGLKLITQDTLLIHRIIRRLSKNIFSIMRKHIWLPRCVETTQWAKTQSNNQFLASYFKAKNCLTDNENQNNTSKSYQTESRKAILTNFNNSTYYQMHAKERQDRAVCRGFFSY